MTADASMDGSADAPKDAPGAVFHVAEQVSTAGSHTCALTKAGRVLCWGSNIFAELGDGSSKDRDGAVTVLASGAVAIAAGDHSCLIKTDGSVWCWGSNN